MQTLFGTDGVRGKANSYPITPEVCLQIGKAIAAVFKAAGHGSKRAIIGKDTRLSGYMLEAALTSGLVSMGMDVYLVGPMPTPAVARLTRSIGAAAGIMITASHNPAPDNGIKIFDSDGFKLSDDIQNEIEALVLGGEISSHHIDLDNIGKAYRIEDARGRYIEIAKSTICSASLAGLTVVLDCANGGAYFLGPLIFKELGARLIKIGVDPDGYNINQGCGVTAPEKLAATVVAEKADIGIALDGDADRALFVDAAGAGS
jgi:phosphoglucosamine mutase